MGLKIHRLSWQKRQEISDGYGGAEGEFAEEFIRWAEIKPSLGIETVTASRLSGKQPVDIVIYNDSSTRQITPSWRAVDINTGVVYSLMSPAIDLDQKRLELTVKAVIGVAA